jgi:fatty-acyl-CoA synthase
MNVYPSEVEQCIAGMPGVAEVAVVGMPHDRWGQTVVAVVVAAADLTEADVVGHCRERLASFKKPSRVVFVDALPRTAGLKVARAALRAQLAAGDGSPQLA